MSTDRRQFAIGVLFLLLGVLLILLAVAPVVIGLLSVPRAHADVSIAFLLIGVVVALFGAWLIPNSGAGPVATQVVAVVGPFLPRVPGLSRVDDPKPAPPKDGAP